MRPYANDSPVIALILVDSKDAYPRVNGSTRILTVVRNPCTNDTHPNVVSVPTSRVPQVLFHALWPRTTVQDMFGRTGLVDWHPRDSRIYRGHDLVIHTVKSILSQKLGLGDALESGTVHFEAGAVAVTVGRSYYDSKKVPNSESIAMITLLVAMRSGAEEIGDRTASYSKIKWVSVYQFLDAVRAKDPSRMRLDPIELCIHGLCITSTYVVMASALAKS